MKKIAVMLIAAFAMSSPFSTEAQETVEKPARVVKSVLKTSAIVEAVDPETRKVKLLGPDGSRFTVVAGPEVRNFAQIEPRDRLVIEYTESIAVVVTPHRPDAAGAGSLGMIDVAAPGQKPHIAGLETRAVTATIVALDRESRRATLQLPDGSTAKVRTADDAPLELVDVGDQVTAMITESLAISVVEPPTE